MDFESNRKTLLHAIAGVVISLLILLFNGLGFFKFMYDWTNYVSEPVIFGAGQFVKGVKYFVSSVGGVVTLKERVALLEVQNDQLSAENRKAKEIELRSEVLSAQIDAELSSGWSLRLARVLGVDRAGPSEHVIIDLGSDDDITLGDPVVLRDILIGEVSDVYKSTSRVRLVTNRDSNIIAMDRDTRAKGLVRGSIEGLMLEDVLESEVLNVGDVVISWSDDFPSNLIIGTVNHVEENPAASTKKAKLTPGVSLENLNYVFVVTDY